MTEKLTHNDLRQAHRIVIKIGSALLVDQSTGRLRKDWLEALAEDIAALRDAGAEVLIVSSGAIALGRRALGITTASLRLEESQAAAAAGQIRLAHAYEAALGQHDLTVAQILVTLRDTEERRRYLNARSTIATLLSLGAIPVVNENDTVATEEIRYGDNDRLAARVAAMISADTLVLLSDIDGLYTADPRNDPDAVHIPEVTQLTAEIEAMAAPPSNRDSSGGMITKLAAARISLGAGCRMAIADGRADHALASLSAGGRATWFQPSETPRSARKKWIAGALKPSGTVTIDDGALRALRSGRSLLPAGVTGIEGSFERGDAVIVADRKGVEQARGISAYGSGDARRIAGRRSDQIEDLLGYSGRSELIHRDDLVMNEAIASKETVA